MREAHTAAILTVRNRFMAASKVLGEETVAASAAAAGATTNDGTQRSSEGGVGNGT